MANEKPRKVSHDRHFYGREMNPGSSKYEAATFIHFKQREVS